MRHFVIGTAGHIDHGKTSLIRALTNIECDTHPEEKKRGITINLGFAYIKKGDDDYLAFVDVPGHHRFISNMVAGASGIDFVMLVVAADDGVMPQTKEHLMICSLLGIKNGIVVINKCDAVDSDSIELCREEIADFVKGTFLENKPIFEVSSLTGRGVDELREYILSDSYDLRLRNGGDFFRMSVDRVFNVTGFGAVVTGTISDGKLQVGDTLNIYPNGKSAKVRGIQRHGANIDFVCKGSRVAIDLAGVKHEDIKFGDIISTYPLTETNIIDVKMSMCEGWSVDLLHFDAIMFCGTAKESVKVKIVEYFNDGLELCATAQVVLRERYCFAYGDRFILRNSSYDTTIAGGYLIDTEPLIHKKKGENLKINLRAIASSSLQYIEVKAEQSVVPLEVEYFVKNLRFSRVHILEIISQSNRLVVVEEMILTKSKVEKFEEIIFSGFAKYAKRNPLSVIGVSKIKLIEFVGDFMFSKINHANDKVIGLLLEKFEREGRIIRKGNRWSLPGMRSDITEKERENISKVESVVAKYGYTAFTNDMLLSDVLSEGVDEVSFRYIVTYLTDLNKLARLNGEFYSVSKLNEARELIVDYLKAHPEGIKASEYRDLLSVNRKTAIWLLEIFDKEKCVIRKDDIRLLP